ncbi:MAG: hypothetical protein QM589_01920 [Thermomicrobiales bacterium]
MALFGDVTANGVEHSDAGRMVDAYIRGLPDTFPRVRVDEWIVMPDHVHILMTLLSMELANQPLASLSAIIGWLKSMAANAYIRGVKEDGWPPFERRSGK